MSIVTKLCLAMMLMFAASDYYIKSYGACAFQLLMTILVVQFGVRVQAGPAQPKEKS